MSEYSLVGSNPDDFVTVGMASIPEREQGMLRVLTQLLPQCDHFDLCLNGYKSDYVVDLPEQLTEDKLTVFVNPTNIGPHGKLYLAHRTTGYFLTVDDDLIYPHGYVVDILKGIEKYGRKAFVGYHGSLLAQLSDPMQPPCRCLFSHQDLVPSDMPVHMLGTGIFGYHSSAGMVDHRQFEPGKIDDQVGAFAQDHRIPMVCLAHPKNWVVEDKELFLKGTAMRRDAPASYRQVERIKARNWGLYLPDNWRVYYR